MRKPDTDLTTTRPLARSRAAAHLLAAFFLFAPSSPALQLIQYDVDSTYSSSHVLVVIDIRNNDTGWTYLYSDLFILSTLADAVWDLPHVRAMFSSKAAMWSQWGKAMLSYEVDYGWTARTSGPDGAVSFARNNGIPGIDYEPWFNTSISPAQDDVRYRVVIPKSHLDHDGDGWSENDPGDYILAVDLDRTIPVAANADSGSAPFTGVGFAYSATPVSGVPAPPSPPRLELVHGAAGAFSIVLSGMTLNAEYWIQRSTNLPADDWDWIETVTAATTTMAVPLPSEGAGPAVCYRASAPPQ